MAKINAKDLAALKEVFGRAQYVKREWKTDENMILSISEYAELVDPTFKFVDYDENAIIIAKERKDGNIFLKMAIPLKGGSIIEFDLSYENDYEEGDELKCSSLQFCVEHFLDKKHGYVTGEIVA